MTIDSVERMNATELQAYWRRLSESHLEQSKDGFEVICYAGMPQWFNKLINETQFKSFTSMLRGESFEDCEILDVGTGIGRWARWYAAWPGASVTGIDLETQRLARARALGGGPKYETMSAAAMSFGDASFDVVSTVAVLQHMPHELKRQSIAEMARVLRPGGRAVVFELTDAGDDAPHVFALREDEWKEQFSQHGLTVKRTAGMEYIPLLRLLKKMHSTVRAEDSRSEIDALKAGRLAPRDRAVLGLLYVAVAASRPIEAICRRLPPSHARLTGFLLHKEPQSTLTPEATGR